VSIFDRIAGLVDQQDFSGLFIGELGWDNPTDPRPVNYVDSESGKTATATPIASKRGVVIYHCPSVLDRPKLEALDREVSRRSIERLLILTEGGEQQWRWPEPRKSGGTRYVTHNHLAGVPNPALFQRLAAVRFTIEEEGQLTVLGVRERIRAQFNVDEVTTRFYEEFRDNQQSLMKEIHGIPSLEEQSWYSSLLLNRLMFIYFMQRKEFLNGDQNYLRNSLRVVRDLQGPDRFYEYYRDFLVPLFHDGLGSEVHEYDDESISRIIGKVPYINGGIFSLHVLEEAYEISVPDETFERIFDFFDRYRWHLDERATGNPEEINPEILGYIFEKYVNQKEQGAYYTKEDVTGYMSGLAILPVLIDQFANATGATPWHLLAEDPRRYVPDGLLYGVDEEPPDAVYRADPSLVGVLDEIGTGDLGLPGERWREILDRRAYAQELTALLRTGHVQTSEAAVSRNLDLQTLLLDWIGELQESDAVASAWEVLSDFKVVDPTCGSGAFLFAALDILEEVYDALLSRAEILNAGGKQNLAVKAIADESANHASREYFLMKRAVLCNLYGVDLMPEATEIARLRLFLALVARLHDRSEIEPLPDLDMNIRAGNLLVGCSTADDAAERFSSNLLAIGRLSTIADQSREAASIYISFVAAQRDGRPATEVNALKRELKEIIALLRTELDLLYSPSEAPGPALDEWRASHRPFHWFVEFPEAMAKGGFDAVIGNPPYVGRAKIREYSYSGFATDTSPDIYAPCMERAATLVKPDGGYGMIVPISFQFSDRGFDIARKAILERLSPCWASTYSRNPAALFDAGLGVRSTIVIARRSTLQPLVLTTGLRRWWDAARPYLFDTNRYEQIAPKSPGAPWPRLGSTDEVELFECLTSPRRTLGNEVSQSGARLGFKQTALYYLSVFVDDPPSWTMDGEVTPQTKIGYLSFPDERTRDLAFMLLAGRLGVWWWGTTGDDFDVTSGLLQSFPVSTSQVEAVSDQLLELASSLRAEQPKHPLVTKYAGKEMGNYDMTRCRDITDVADQAVLRHLGLERHWPTVLLADASLAKATGERPGTRREWPFPW